MPEAGEGFLEMENEGRGIMQCTGELQQGISCPLAWNGRNGPAGAPGATGVMGLQGEELKTVRRSQAPGEGAGVKRRWRMS